MNKYVIYYVNDFERKIYYCSCGCWGRNIKHATILNSFMDAIEELKEIKSKMEGIRLINFLIEMI
jgi:hypothetical protein